MAELITIVVLVLIDRKRQSALKGMRKNLKDDIELERRLREQRERHPEDEDWPTPPPYQDL